jgi:enoyl-CoA hydratase/carnithine racemase
MTTPVDVRRHGGVLQVVLDDPARRNALSRSLLRGLREVLTGPVDGVTGVVLSGRGNTFSAGADFRELTGTRADAQYDGELAVVTRALRDLPRVVVAALEGPCIGAAADLALSCDLRVAAQGSYLRVPAVRLGLLYNPDAVERLRRAYPRDSVRRLLLLAERFDAEKALDAGLVSQVVARGEAVRHALELLEPIGTAELDAVSATKALLNAQEDGDADSDHWARRRWELLDSPARRSAFQRARRRHAGPEADPDDERAPDDD